MSHREQGLRDKSNHRNKLESEIREDRHFQK